MLVSPWGIQLCQDFIEDSSQTEWAGDMGEGIRSFFSCCAWSLEVWLPSITLFQSNSLRCLQLTGMNWDLSKQRHGKVCYTLYKRHRALSPPYSRYFGLRLLGSWPPIAMWDTLLALFMFKDLKIMPVSASQIIVMRCFENKPLKELFSKPTCIVNRNLE